MIVFMYRFDLRLCFLLLAVAGVTAAAPHWYLKLQAGGGADVGEAKFSQLLTPSLQLGLGYQLT